MATLQQINGIYHLRFRFGGKAFRRSLGTTNGDDAEAIKKQAEVHLHHINVGLIDQPPQNADVIQYILSGGKSVAKPKVAPSNATTLAQLWTGYLESLPAGAKEENSLDTETTHFTHLLRILKPTTAVTDLGTDHLQRYINARSKQKGRRGTIKSPTIGSGRAGIHRRPSHIRQAMGPHDERNAQMGGSEKVVGET